MNTIMEIITFSLICFLVVSGLFVLVNKAGEQGNLDTDSLNKVALYEPMVLELQSNYTLQFNNTENISDYEPNQNSIGDFFKEFNEAKSRVQQMTGIAKLIYKYPDILLLSIPLLDDDSVATYRMILWILIGLLLFTAIYNAIIGKQITPQP